jgi:hypothetical protein
MKQPLEKHGVASSMLLRLEDKGFQPDLDFTIERSQRSRRTREHLRVDSLAVFARVARF